MKPKQLKRKILVIDDDESILDAVSLVLEDAAYVVKTSLKGERTIELARSFQPSVILLDVLMSGQDGREICKMLKKTLDTKTIPVVMISAHPSARRGALDCGADSFLAKPFDSDNLIDVIESQL